MMTEWMAMLFRAALRYLQRILRDALEDVTAGDVEGAKAQMEAGIQRQKRIPGTIRRWLCWDVRRIQAASVEQFKARLAAEIEQLG